MPILLDVRTYHPRSLPILSEFNISPDVITEAVYHNMVIFARTNSICCARHEADSNFCMHGLVLVAGVGQSCCVCSIGLKSCDRRGLGAAGPSLRATTAATYGT